MPTDPTTEEKSGRRTQPDHDAPRQARSSPEEERDAPARDDEHDGGFGDGPL